MKPQKLFKSSTGSLAATRLFIVLFLGISMMCLEVSTAEAQPSTSSGRQIQPIRRPLTPPVNTCQPTSIYIRNVPYNDYSRYSRLNSSGVTAGNYIQVVADRCVTFSRNLSVTLQDVTRGSGYGVTVFRFRDVYVNGNTVWAYVPNYAFLKNRTYHVAVFDFGHSPFVTVNPGTVTVQ